MCNVCLYPQARVMATIGVTRGLGDHDLKVYSSNIYIKPFLSCVPEVSVRSEKQLRSPRLSCFKTHISSIVFFFSPPQSQWDKCEKLSGPRLLLHCLLLEMHLVHCTKLRNITCFSDEVHRNRFSFTFVIPLFFIFDILKRWEREKKKTDINANLSTLTAFMHILFLVSLFLLKVLLWQIKVFNYSIFYQDMLHLHIIFSKLWKWSALMSHSLTRLQLSVRFIFNVRCDEKTCTSWTLASKPIFLHLVYNKHWANLCGVPLTYQWWTTLYRHDSALMTPQEGGTEMWMRRKKRKVRTEWLRGWSGKGKRDQVGCRQRGGGWRSHRWLHSNKLDKHWTGRQKQG